VLRGSLCGLLDSHDLARTHRAESEENRSQAAGCRNTCSGLVTEGVDSQNYG